MQVINIWVKYIIKEYLTISVRNMKGAHAKPATVIPSTARYDEICGGAGPSVTIILKNKVYLDLNNKNIRKKYDLY